MFIKCSNTKYNTEDEDLTLWRCHPEKTCLNCKYLWMWPEDALNNYFAMSCEHNDKSWSIHQRNSDFKENFIVRLLTARNCDGFELKAGIKNEL